MQNDNLTDVINKHLFTSKHLFNYFWFINNDIIIGVNGSELDNTINKQSFINNIQNNNVCDIDIYDYHGKNLTVKLTKMKDYHDINTLENWLFNNESNLKVTHMSDGKQHTVQQFINNLLDITK